MSIRRKLMLVLLATALLPLAAGSWYAVDRSRGYAEAQLIQNLTFAAEQTEGQVIYFFETQKARAADWSSDCHIREEAEAIAILLADPAQLPAAQERADRLATYVRENKMVLEADIDSVEI